jgi:predicted nucleic acid-binding protein
MKVLFVDTNILLSFYYLSSEDLEELRKLIALIDKQQILLLTTEQVKNEFHRNRGAKIADALVKLREAKFNLSFPVFAKGYSEYDELKELLRKADQKHAELIKRIQKDAKADEISADALVSELLKKSQGIEITNDVYLEALKRVRLGNPPGKEQSMGDAVNWEGLLAKCPDGVDLHLVSADKDYRSQLFGDEFNEFLKTEWNDRKKSDVIFYTKISDFFRTNFPDIKIASEVAAVLEKDTLIDQLTESWSFAQTHTVIGKLLNQNNFSLAQVRQLIDVATSNTQVGWIVGDTDVHEFYAGLLKEYGEQLPQDQNATLHELVQKGLASEN